MNDCTYHCYEQQFEPVKVGEMPPHFKFDNDLDPGDLFEGNKNFIKHLVGIPDDKNEVDAKNWPIICLTFLFQIPTFDEVFALNCVCINVYLRTNDLNVFRKPGINVFKDLLFDEMHKQVIINNQKMKDIVVDGDMVVRGNFEGLFGDNPLPQMYKEHFVVTTTTHSRYMFGSNQTFTKRLEHVIKQKSKFNVFDAFWPSTCLNTINLKPTVIKHRAYLPNVQAYDEYKNVYRNGCRHYYRPQLTPDEPIGTTFTQINEYGEPYDEIVLPYDLYQKEMEKCNEGEEMWIPAPLYFLSNYVATYNDEFIKGIQIMRMNYCKANLNYEDKKLIKMIGEGMEANVAQIYDILAQMLIRLNIRPYYEEIYDLPEIEK